jgi:hypothetical protein
MSFTVTPSGLWVAQSETPGPPHALGLVVAEAPGGDRPTVIVPRRPGVRDGVAAYVTEADLRLRTLGKAGVIARLTQLPSELTLINLAALLRRLA